MKIIKIMRGCWKAKILIGALLIVGLFYNTAFAAGSTTINAYTGAATFVYNETGVGNSKLPITDVVQMIQASGGVIHPPNPDGTPSGGDVLIKSGTISNALGSFYITNAFASNTVIYMRAWNASTIGNATKYGDSVTNPVNVSDQVVIVNWAVPSFATTLNKPGPNQAPGNPTGLVQYKSDATTVLAAGSWTNENSVIVKFTVADPNAGNVTPQVQYRPLGGAWSAPVSGNPVASGSTGTVNITGLVTNTQYEWQARASDGSLTSSWVDYNNNANVADFKVDSTGPSAVNITSPATPTKNNSLNFSWTAATDGGSGLNATPYYYLLDASSTATAANVKNSGTGTANLNATVTGAAGNNYLHVVAVDAAGNLSAVANSTVVVFDNIAPTISSFDPANGANGVATNKAVVITFSEPINAASFAYSINPDPGGKSVVPANGNTSTITISHTAFQNSTAYTVTVNGVNDLAGNALVLNNNTASFTTVAPNAPVIDSIAWDTKTVNNTTNAGFTYGTLNLISSSNAFGENVNKQTIPANCRVEIKPYGEQNFIDITQANTYWWEKGKVQVGIPVNLGSVYPTAGPFDVRIVINNVPSAAKTDNLRPRLYGATPLSGPVGTSLAIEGRALGADTNALKVKINGVDATVTAVDNTTATVQVSDPSTTTGLVSITLNGQTSNTKFIVKDQSGNDIYGDDIIFTVEPGANQPAVTGVSPNKAAQGQTLTLTISGTNNNWNGDMKSAISISGSGITLNSATATGPNAITASITVDPAAAEGDRTISLNGSGGSVTLTIVKPGALNANISGIVPSTAFTGQTIVINGSNFGANKGGSTVTIGGAAVNPTAWSDSAITLAVPSGLAAGAANVVVTVSGQPATGSVTVDNSKVYIDDFEGGSAGTFAGGLFQSGYYTFGAGVAPDNNNISTKGPLADAKHDGAKGMKIKYSFANAAAPNDWGGGWGALLANQVDLSKMDKISFYINWDGSDNNVKVSLKDSDGTTYSATISGAYLKTLSGYAQVVLDRNADFTYDADSSKPDPANGYPNPDAVMDWAKIVSYSIIYNTKLTSDNYHNLDTLVAYSGGGGSGGGDNASAPVINSLTPSSAPAGIRFTVAGANFGANQGTSKLVFTNKDTGASYQAEIVAWNDTAIEAIVPRTSVAGKYSVIVRRETMAAGAISAHESNPANFQVTAAVAETATIYPNPFNAGRESVTIAISNTGGATKVGYNLYDMTARLVYRQVLSTNQTTWDGRDLSGATVGDGAYLLRIINEDTKTMLAKGKVLVVKH